jgi:hypothetical protein
MIFEIDEKQHKKINLWLNEIQIEDEYFPQITYTFIPGAIGTVIIVKERVTNKELDITDMTKW